MLMAVVTVAGLSALNKAPMLATTATPTTYTSVDEVSRLLKTGKILLPTYFPEYLQWPASEIYARADPHFSMAMHFKRATRDKITLSLQQSDVDDPDPIPSRITPTRTEHRWEDRVQDVTIQFTQGYCTEGERCNQATWDDTRFRYTVVAKDDVRQLLKTVESMLSR